VRIISTRCSLFEYTVTAKGPCAVDTASAIGVHRYFHDCLRVTVGVAHGDLALAGAAVRTVQRIVAETGAGPVVIDGVAHLPMSGDLMSAATDVDVLSALADTLDVLVEITERLEERGERVHLMPFGWHKSSHTRAVAGAAAQRIIHLAANGKSERTGAARDVHPCPVGAAVRMA
jgi:hypothetical protein